MNLRGGGHLQTVTGQDRDRIHRDACFSWGTSSHTDQDDFYEQSLVANVRIRRNSLLLIKP